MSRKNINNIQDGSDLEVQKKIYLTNQLESLPILDNRFTAVAQAGHSTIVPATIGDLNDSGNTNWLMPATATTLEVVSGSASDTVAAGSGLQIIALIGLDQNLAPITDVILMDGTTPVTSVLSFRALNFAVAVAGGTPGSGAAGIITISATTGGQVFGRFIVDDSTCEVGRYTVAAGYKFLFHNAVSNGGADADMTLKFEITALGAFPISLGELYLGSGVVNNIFNGRSLLDSGTTVKLRAFTNSGSPATRKLNGSIIGVLASVAAWDSLQC